MTMGVSLQLRIMQPRRLQQGGKRNEGELEKRDATKENSSRGCRCRINRKNI
jgi:hypothetical protein